MDMNGNAGFSAKMRTKVIRGPQSKRSKLGRLVDAIRNQWEKVK
jgi:hypothetical protein